MLKETKLNQFSNQYKYIYKGPHVSKILIGKGDLWLKKKLLVAELMSGS